MTTVSSLVVQRRLATLRQVEEALARQVLYGGDVVTSLLEVSPPPATNETALTNALADALGIAPAPLDSLRAPDSTAVAKVPRATAEEHGVVPIAWDQGAIVVALAEPLSTIALSALTAKIGAPIKQTAAPLVRLRQALEHAYGVPMDRRMRRLVAMLEGNPPSIAPPKSEIGRLSIPELSDDPMVVPKLAETPAPKASTRPPPATTIRASNPGPQALQWFLRDAHDRASAPNPQLAPPTAKARAKTPDEPREDLRASQPRLSMSGRRRRGPFTREEAERVMLEATSSDQIFGAVVEFAQQYFTYVALFLVKEDLAEGWDAHGPGASGDRVRKMGVPLDLPSLFSIARDRRSPVLQKRGSEGLDGVLAADLGRGTAGGNGDVVAIPVTVGKRVVAIVWGDDDAEPMALEDLADVQAIASVAASSVARIIVQRKKRSVGAAPPPPPQGPGSETALLPSPVSPAEPKTASTRPEPRTKAPRPDLATRARALTAALIGPRKASTAPPPAPPSESGAPASPSPAAASIHPAPASATPAPASVPAPMRVQETPRIIAEAKSERPVPAELAPTTPLRARVSTQPAPALQPQPARALTPAPTSAPRPYSTISEVPQPRQAASTSPQVPEAMPPRKDTLRRIPALAPMEPIESAPADAKPAESKREGEPAPSMGRTTNPYGLEGGPTSGSTSASNASIAKVELKTVAAAAAAAPPSIHEQATRQIPRTEALPADAIPPPPPDAVAPKPSGPTAAALEPDEAEPMVLRPSMTQQPSMPMPMPPPPSLAKPRPIAPPIPREEPEEDPFRAGPKITDVTPAVPVTSEPEMLETTEVTDEELEELLAETAMPPPREGERVEVYAPRSPPRPSQMLPDLSLPKVIVALDADHVIMVERLIRGGEAGEKAEAELRKLGAAALPAIMDRFPGPTRCDRTVAVSQLPHAREAGVLLTFLVRLGRLSLRDVLARVGDPSPEARFWATYLLTEIVDHEAAPQLVPRLVDDDLAVRRVAALAARAMLQAIPRAAPLLVDPLVGVLLDAGLSASLRVRAAHALGEVRDARAAEGLILGLESYEKDVGAACHEALIALARHDPTKHKSTWPTWYSQNKQRSRIEWLIDALTDPDEGLREAAGTELKALTKVYFGYYANLPRIEREAAQVRYRKWWDEEGKTKFQHR